jgi:drug/metabolite transporter (DMT)-like permease
VLSARVVGVVGVTAPLALAGRLRLSRPALPYVVAAGVVEVLGTFTFTFGARESTAVTAVVASQYAPLAAVLAFLLFRERLGRLQVVGVGLIVVGVTALSAVGSG